MNKLVLALGVICVLASGCAAGDGDKGGGGRGVVDYSPSQRWPEKGDYSYDISYSMNGVKCQTGRQAFSAKADYCMAVQNSELNNHCALPTRRSIYLQECGDDFQEFNFKANFLVMGYDQRLQRSCQTARPSKEIFKNNKEYCDFLKDEGAHQSCFWDRRREEFKDRKCEGDFSLEPILEVSPGETPSEERPRPTPKPSATPTPDPLLDVPVVRDLKDQGIAVEIDWESIRRRTLPGRMDYREAIPIFFRELESNRDRIIANKRHIKKITLTVYTKPSGEVLDWDYETPAGGMSEYLPLLEQLLHLAEELRIKFFFIHSGYTSDSSLHLPLKKMLAALESYKPHLKTMSPLIEKIELGSYSHYFSSSKSLTLTEKDMSRDLGLWIDLLKPLVPVYAWGQSQGVKISADFDLKKDASKVHGAFIFLEKHIAMLEKARKAGLLEMVQVSFFKSSANYYEYSKNLSLSIDGANPGLLPQVLTQLGEQASLSLAWSRPASLGFSDLAEDYIKAVENLRRLAPSIRLKIHAIKEVSVRYSTSYLVHTQRLSIGSTTSLKESEDIILKIK